MIIKTHDGKIQEQKPFGEQTGFTDNGNMPIKVGDFMVISHWCNCEYCRHSDRVQILWNAEWPAYGMKTADGRWISGMGIAAGYLVVS